MTGAFQTNVFQTNAFQVEAGGGRGGKGAAHRPRPKPILIPPVKIQKIPILAQLEYRLTRPLGLVAHQVLKMEYPVKIRGYLRLLPHRQVKPIMTIIGIRKPFIAETQFTRAIIRRHLRKRAILHQIIKKIVARELLKDSS